MSQLSQPAAQLPTTSSRPTQSFDRRRLTVDQRSTTAADLEAIAKQYNEGRAEAKAKGGKSPTSPSGKKGGFSLFGRSK